jgi:hypothetical protein
MECGRGAADSEKNEGISGLGVRDGGKLGDFGFRNSVALTGLAVFLCSDPAPTGSGLGLGISPRWGGGRLGTTAPT